MFSRLTSANVRVRLLERDPDTLSLLEQELRGVALPHRKTPARVAPAAIAKRSANLNLKPQGQMWRPYCVGCLTTWPTKMSSYRNRATACGNDTLGSTTNTAVIANEIGENKAALIRDLVDQYLTLNEASPAVVHNTRDVAVDKADYLFAYRLYDFGWLKVKDRRIVYLKLHYRIVHLESGRVVVSGFRRSSRR